MSSGWRYKYDIVWMGRHVQGETLYMCGQSGVDGKVYVGVIVIVIMDFVFYGRALKSTTLPRLPGITQTKDFDSFSSSCSEDDND